MLLFTTTTDGATLINNAVEGSSPVIIDSVVFYDSNSSAIGTFTNISGSVYNDGNGIGEYAKIIIEDNTSSGYTVSSIALKAGSTVVANLASSETISIVKKSGKGLKLEISCKFTGAYKCGFSTYSIALPSATQFREGVVRLARSENETSKNFTVYSASDIDNKFANIADTFADDLVPWKKVSGSAVPGIVVLEQVEIVDDIDSSTKTVTITVTGSVGSEQLSINKTITGNAVSSSPTISGGTITSSSSGKVVNEAYIASLYANEISSANNTKLVTSYAVSEYVDDQLEAIDDDYVHLAGNETVGGIKTFTDGVVSSSYTGDGVYSTYASNTWDTTGSGGTQSKLPTVGAVADALDALNTTITNAYQLADSGLQSQIDGINAGQNLADIVDTKTLLVSHSLTDLKAKNDYKSGDSGPVWSIGDKLQVLHDTTTSNGTYDDSTAEKIAAGIATVYELIKGTIDTTTYPKDVASSTTGYYWHYIGAYGSDSYSKSEADNKYVAKATLDQTLASTSSTTNAPSTKAVYDAIDALETSLGSDYVKLTSSTSQTIASPLVIKQATASTAKLSIPDGQHLTANNTLTIKSDNTTNSVSTDYDLTNVAYTVKLGNSTALNLTKTGTTTPVADVSGDLVASYRDSSITNGTLTDGRLVTVDYLTHFTGDLSDYPKLSENNTFTGTTNTFAGVSATSYTGTGVQSSTVNWNASGNESKIPTVEVVDNALDELKDDVLETISTTNSVGSIGLFMYSEVGNEKGYGEVIDGQYLKPVGLSLPMSGQISYKSVASSPSMSGSWKLLSVAFKRTSTEPCLVLAQKVGATFSNP